MKALTFHQYGLSDVLKLEEVEKPVPKDNEVLVKVKAASINDWDWAMLQGIPFLNRMQTGLRKPTRINILGCDIAGRVEAVGKNETKFKVGDEVYGDLSSVFSGGWGGFAEYVCARESALTLKPACLTFEQAAAVPQAAMLALQGLLKGKIQQEKIKPTQKVLINGASGGVGSFAVPMAKSIGAEVTGVCSTKKKDFVRLLGADNVIDYTREDFTKNNQHYDLILDVKGFHSLLDYKHALSRKGRYVMLGGADALATKIMFFGRLISMMGSKKMGILFLKANKGLDIMKPLFESGKITPVIDKCFPLNEGAEAMRFYGEGHAKGKVVVTMEENS